MSDCRRRSVRASRLHGNAAQDIPDLLIDEATNGGRLSRPSSSITTRSSSLTW